jgi:hypothetical protein
MPINEYDATPEADFKSASYSYSTTHLIMLHLKYFIKHLTYFVPPPPSSDKILERVELYLYSP